MQEGTQIPAPPAPPKKRRVWPWILLGIVAVLVIQAIPTATNQPQPATPTIEFEEPGISDDTQMSVLRLVWDTEMTAVERSDICDYYNTPPVGTTPEMVRAFAEGAEIPYDDADRLLDQLLAEKC